MSAYDQIPIRLQLTNVSIPSAPPLDLNTGEFPQCFAGSQTTFEIGIFNAQQVCVDLSNLDSLEVVLWADRISSTDNPALVTKTIDQYDLVDVISWENWVTGIESQATVVFTSEDTAQYLNGRERRRFFLQVRGIIGDAKLIYGLAQLYIYDSGAVDIVATGWDAYTDDWDTYINDWSTYT